MRIITVGREFSSGGRELGKRLADALGFAYYDREIITEIAKRTNLDENYVADKLEKGIVPEFNITYGHTFLYSYMPMQNDIKILVSERELIQEIAEKGEDFVIVGRNADVILKNYKPFNLFVYADMPSKIKRCQERADKTENYTPKELEKKIKQIDTGRAKRRELITDSKWGRKESYDLCINTSNIVIKDIVPLIAEYALSRFERNEK